MKLKVGIIGATGYAGLELLRLLINHPNAEVVAVSSVSYEGQDIASIYPNLNKLFHQILTTQENTIAKSEVVFVSLPPGLSEELAYECFEKNKLFIDLGADFRLEDESLYTEWYGGKYTHKDVHKAAVYGLSEIYREKIKSARIIANPGCYPTSVAFGLYPALKNNLIDTENIIIDSKSGVTGAGRGLTQKTHFPDCNESFSPYSIGKHRHTTEIEQSLSKIADKQIKVTFVPHLLPINRGIVSTIYTNYKCIDDKDLINKIYKIYKETYKNEPFIRMLPLGETADLKNVKYGNYCDISVHLDKHTGKLIIISAIDNMVKGAAGQAIQNMNIACGLNEGSGLDIIPPAF